MQVHSFIYRLIISRNLKFLVVVVSEFLCFKKKVLNRKKRKTKDTKKERRGRNSENSNVGASKFEKALLNSKTLFFSCNLLVFELERFEPLFGFLAWKREHQHEYHANNCLLNLQKLCSKYTPSKF